MSSKAEPKNRLTEKGTMKTKNGSLTRRASAVMPVGLG